MKIPSLADEVSYHLIIIAFLALCILGIGSHYLWTGNLNTTAIGQTMNDQVGYITASRNLSESGKLESSLYYPALLNYYKGHNLLYMPGNYYIHALFFSLLGYSIFTAFLPSLLAFIGSALMLFLIARHFFNKETAYLSTICFMLFPPVVLYAYSAMMELLFVFFCLFAFFIFLKIPPKLRFIIGGLPLAAPYIIRESAVLMLPGLAIMVFLEGGNKRLLKSLFFAMSTLLLFFFIKKIPFISDIPPHFALSLINISGLYTDAFAVKNIHLSYLETLIIMLKNTLQNISDFQSVLFSWKYWPAGFTFYLMVLVLSGVCMIILRYNRKISRSFGYFTITTVLILIAVTFSILMYFMNSGIRQILFMVPFLLCIVFYALSTSEISKRRGLILSLQAIILFSCSVLFLISINNFRNDFIMANAYEQKCNTFLDSLGVSKSAFFVAPHEISLDYVNTHYPVRWSFVPSNEETLKLLSKKYPVDVFIIPLGHPLTVDMKEQKVKTSLLDGAFSATETRVFNNAAYLVYRPVGRK